MVNLILDFKIYLCFEHYYCIDAQHNPHKLSKSTFTFNKENVNEFTNYIENKPIFNIILKVDSYLTKLSYWKHIQHINNFKYVVNKHEMQFPNRYSLVLEYYSNKKTTLTFDPIKYPQELEAYKLKLI